MTSTQLRRKRPGPDVVGYSAVLQNLAGSKRPRPASAAADGQRASPSVVNTVTSMESEEPSDEDINNIGNPHAIKLLSKFPLSKAMLSCLRASLVSQEETSIESGAVDTSGIPYHTVLALVLNLSNAQRIQEIYKQQELQAKALHKARNDIALLKKADAEEVQNMYNLRKITTTFWFSGSSPGYSVGETRNTGPSKLVEDVVMQYFASDPSCLGSNGRSVLENADGRDGVRKQVKSKLDGLRNATKKAIHDSLHKLSLLALAQDLFHYWEIAITPSRLRRLALIRTWSLTFPPYHEEMNEDGDIVTESNRLFWPSIDQALAHLNADLADPARRAAARKFIDDAVKTDQDVHGTYNFDWDRHRPAQQDEAKLDRYFDASYDVVASGSGHLALSIGSDTAIEASGSGSQMHQASYQRESRQRRQNPAGTGETDSESSQEVRA